MPSLPDYLQGFTDREPQIAAFDALWDDNTRWMLAFSGHSGVGKSYLSNYLIETRCKPQAIHFRKIDFDNVVALEDLPIAVSRLLPDEAQNQFRQAERSARQAHEQAILELDKHVPDRVTLMQKADRGGRIGDSPATIDVQYEERRRDLSRWFFTRLARLVLDQAAVMGNRRAVLLLDTYEKFAGNNKDEIIGRLWWFISQVAEQAPGLRVVVAGREQLPYRPLAYVTRDEPLGDFDAATSDLFLKQRGVDDPALRYAAFDLAFGHPLTTRMFAEAHQEALHARRPISLHELRQGTRARSREEWFYELILSRLPEPERTAATYGPLLRHFNSGVLKSALALEFNEDEFHRFSKRSFIKRVGDGQYKFHELAQTVQRAYLYASAEGRVLDVHRRAAEFYTNPTTTSDTRDWLYHSLIVAPQTIFERWEEALGQAILNIEHEWWVELLEAAEIPFAQYGLQTEQRARVWYERLRWHYYHLKDLDEGLKKGRIALALYQQVGDNLGEANTLQALGDVQAFQKDNKSAVASYTQALALYVQIGSRLGKANALQSLGQIQAFQNNNKEASAIYMQALALYRQEKDHLGEANTLQVLGDIQVAQSDNEAALKSYAQALALYRRTGFRPGEAHVLQALGDLQAFQEDSETAARSYAQALELFQQMEDRLGEANTLQALGRMQAFQKDNKAAVASYMQSLALYQQVGDRVGEAHTLQSLGDVRSFQGDRETAITSYKQALALCQQVGDRVGEANALHAIGVVQAFQKNNEAAIVSYKQALALYQQIGDHLGEANTLRSLGDVRAFEKDHETAVASYMQALALYQQTGDHLGEANTLRSLGDVQSFQNDNEAALRSYTQALAFCVQAGSRVGEANTLQSLGRFQMSQNDNEAALKSYTRALAIYQQVEDHLGEANTLQVLGDVQALQKDTETAVESYTQALTLYQLIGDHLGEANVFFGLGRMALNVGDEQHGIEYLEQSARLYESIGAQSGSANVWAILAELAASKGDFRTAINYLQPAVDFGKRIKHPLGDQLQSQIDEWQQQLKG